MSEPASHAFGWPGISPRWTSSAKSGIGTAFGCASRVWFTLSHGILNEIYYPRVDQACTRDMGMIVTGGDYFSEEKRHADSAVEYLVPGVPAFRVVNTCLRQEYRIEKEIIADPDRNTVLQRTKFVPLTAEAALYRLHVLLAPHLANRGSGNTAWLGDYKGRAMLFAERGDAVLALAASVGWIARSVGFVGYSDGWQDLVQHQRMTWQFERAENGNVALTGELDWKAAKGHTFVLAVGFGAGTAEAGQHAEASLLADFDELKARYIEGWRSFHRTLRQPSGRRGSNVGNLGQISATLLRVHEDKGFPGGMIASLSIPWGFNKGDDDLGGYHLVWPRDLVESAGGLLSFGARSDTRRVLNYLMATQEADGHWPQNMWLDGVPYWSQCQMDETGFPILLVDLALREKALKAGEMEKYWPMIRRAAQFIVRNGPVTQQDRWEEDAGYSPFTLSVEISALLAAADFAERNNEAGVADYLWETADAWNSNVERWTYVTGTDLARQLSVEGYYARISPPETADGASPLQGFVPIKNRPPGSGFQKADHVISPDALALVRFGLRAADDPRVLNTVRAIDSLLKTDTPFGPAWHRYNGDGYGEHEDGSPFDGTGIGRAWPLLTGERGHYEVVAGRTGEARRLLKAMESFANGTGLIPEQIWDAGDVDARELKFGRPSGSAMPLAWAHAEYLKLRRSIEDKRVFDMPPQAWQRYQVQQVKSRLAIWRFNHKCRSMQPGLRLRVETLSPATLHWSVDGWRSIHDSATRDTGLGIQVVDLPTDNLSSGERIDFTFYWPEAGGWERVDFSVVIGGD